MFITNGYVILDNAVTTAKILDNAVTLAKMADASVGTAELVDASVTGAKLDTASIGGLWNLLETLSPSAATTISTGALAAYDLYRIEVRLDYDGVAGADEFVHVRFNSDSSALHYSYGAEGGSSSFTDTSARLLRLQGAKLTKNYAEWIVQGITAAIALGRAQGSCTVYNADSQPSEKLSSIGWAGGNAQQIALMTFLRTASVSTFSGTIKVWGRNI